MMVKKQEKYNIVRIVFFVLLMLPFMSLTGIKGAMGETIYQAWQISSFVLFALFVVFKLQSIRLTWAVSLFALYELVVIFSSVINNGFNYGIIVVSLVAILLFIVMQSKYYREVLVAVSAIIVISVIVNFPMMLTELNEPNAELFIGGKNALGVFLIPSAFLLVINSFENNEKLTIGTVLLLGLSFITIIMGASGTGIVTSACAIILLIIAAKFQPQKITYLAVILSLYALLLVFTEFFFNTTFWLNFVNMLGKDSTLTSRTTIWQIVIDLVKENWLLGAGRGVEFGYVNTWGGDVIHSEAHNFILEILMCSGIVGLSLYGMLFFKTVNRLNMGITKHRMAFVALCVLLINGLTESTVNNFLVITILGIACRYAVTGNENIDIKS